MKTAKKRLPRPASSYSKATLSPVATSIVLSIVARKPVLGGLGRVLRNCTANMRERAFIARRQDGWEQLEALLRAADRGGLRRLSPDQLQELALRYRSATTDLAAAQSRDYSPEVRAYLNRLTARAHAYVYVGGARNGWSRLSEFFGGTFPREFRSSGRTIAACTTLFALAALVAYWQVEQRPLSVYALLPASLVPVVQKSLHNSNFAFDRSFAPAVASQIITNNVKVAMIEFAGGIRSAC